MESKKQERTDVVPKYLNGYARMQISDTDILFLF